jgi:ribosome recycling factor
LSISWRARNVRRDGNDAFKEMAKDKKIGEDEEKRAMEEFQKMTDEEIRKMEELSRKKRSGSDAGVRCRILEQL